jgi:hypothetical protein
LAGWDGATSYPALLLVDGRSQVRIKVMSGNVRRFESDKHFNAAITPSDFFAPFFDDIF